MKIHYIGFSVATRTSAAFYPTQVKKEKYESLIN